jgi:hypothetical protein
VALITVSGASSPWSYSLSYDTLTDALSWALLGGGTGSVSVTRRNGQTRTWSTEELGPAMVVALPLRLTDLNGSPRFEFTVAWA